MVFLVIWVIMGVVVGAIARSLNRDPIVWGVYGFVLWPLALIHLLIIGESKAETAPPAPTRPCPKCAEAILFAAQKCKHCGSEIEPLPEPKSPEFVA